ncbi:universal stress protein [Rhodococcus sp. NPDC019627]|uniref:universal stress protein n=1 Tax=unclassified Rhodococcus (in: high G+C Gram-positive bacteria) TaxID=192944 RepID=UPI0033D40F48
MSTTPIVVGVDGSPPSSEAVRWGVAEAILRSAPLLLLACVSYRGAESLPLVGAELRERAERDLTAATELARAHDPRGVVHIRTELHWQYAPAVLVDRSESARMIVLGRRGLGEFTGGLIGSVTSAVARHAHCPVVVIEGAAASPEEGGVGPVVVGVDGSDNSEPAIALAFEESALRRTTLIALHAWSDQDLSTLPMGTGPDRWKAVAESEQALLGESLTGCAEQYPDVPVQQVLVRDRPVRHLLAQAEEAQLLVVGTRGRGGFKGMTLGSTSAALLHTAPCPLIVVPRC